MSLFLKPAFLKKDRMKKYRKISTRFRELLKQELPSWQTDGIISAEQSDVISQKYQLDQIQKESTRLLISAIYIIGAILICGGIISFIAAHWEKIPASVKVAMIVAVMLTSHTIGYYLWKISGKSPRLGHALVVLGTLVFGANIGLMAQIFHIRANFYNGLFAWALGAITMAYALQSVPNAVVGILVWFIGFCGGVEAHERIFAIYPFIAAVVFLLFAYLNRSILVFSLSLLATGFAIVIHTFDGSRYLISSGLVAPGIGLLLLGGGLLLKRTANYSEFGPCAMTIAAIFAAFGAYVSSFHSYGMRFPELLNERLWLAPTIAVYVLSIAVWLFAWKRVLSDAQARWISAGLLISCILTAAPILITPLLMSSPDSFWCVVFANTACVILAATLIVNGFLLLDRRIFWAGIIFAALVITSRFLEYETGLLIKAVVFITCGIVLILAGVEFENYLKRRRFVNE
jgi:uncharacterized membrane protein